MRAIFIDSNNRKVTEIQIENELNDFYQKIGCDVIECIDIGENHTLVCDENGRLRNLPTGFRLSGPTIIAGNALIVGTDEDDFVDARAPLSLFQRNVEFIDLREDPLPASKWTFIPLD